MDTTEAKGGAKMAAYGYAEKVRVGSVFARTDRNGREWRAVVTNRTDYFVDVEIHTPYADGGANDIEGRERVMIQRGEKDEPTGRMKTSIFTGKEVPEMRRVPSGPFYINLPPYNLGYENRRGHWHWRYMYTLKSERED